MIKYHERLIENVLQLKAICDEHKATKIGSPIVMTSGAFDPLHVGHIRCLQASSMLKGPNGLLIVVVNNDEFLMKTKGFIFMPLVERLELISAIEGVDYVLPYGDKTLSVSHIIKELKPNIFAKGGDRKSKNNVPEYNTCVEVKCAVVFGIGGDEKIQSSSKLLENMKKAI